MPSYYGQIFTALNYCTCTGPCTDCFIQPKLRTVFSNRVFDVFILDVAPFLTTNSCMPLYGTSGLIGPTGVVPCNAQKKYRLLQTISCCHKIVHNRPHL